MRAPLLFSSVVALALASGCSDPEYNLNGEVAPDVVANPADVDTPVHTDTLVQVTKPEVDVLWVVDNSSSMIEEADKLTRNFPYFLDYFIGSGMDWHVGVVSTNMELAGHKGKLREAQGYRWITPDTPAPVAVFGQMTPYYPGTSHQESGREAVVGALEVHKNDYNAGFLRDNSSLHIVVISDENDHSTQPSLPEYVEWLEQLRPPGDITVSSIVGIEMCAGSYEIGTDYLAVTNQIGGFVWSICEDDWAPALDQLGLQAAGLDREFYLSQLPVEDTMSVLVEVDGVTLSFEEETDWLYDASRNSIVFVEYIPPALAKVQVTYEVAAAFQP